MNISQLDSYFADQLAADRHPVATIEISATIPAVRDAVYAGVSRLAETFSARHENGAVDLSRGPVSGVQVLSVGRHSVADIKSAVRSARSLRAGVIVIDDMSEPELTRFLDHYVPSPMFV